MKRVFMLVAFAAMSALVGVQFAAGAGGNGNHVLAQGTVTENVSPSDWTISFDIHSRGMA